MALIDNREFFNVLEKAGQGIRVTEEVDWDLEAGAIVRRVCELGKPAPLFENIQNYAGHRILGAPLATFSRLALAMGLSPEVSVAEIASVYLERTQRPGPAPELLSEGPCQENVYIGDTVNLLDIPAPMVHEGDGGRYLSTWHLVVTKDPETSEVNWGMYRQMVVDERTMVGPLLPFSDGGRLFHGKFVPANKPMPFATVIGADPLSSIAAAAAVPWSEPLFSSALSGEPVALVKCKTVDLEVPAYGEYIIEGEVIPNVSLEEGPFGEYPGYRTSMRAPRTIYRVNAITHRHNPIVTICNLGIPVDENLLRCFTIGLEMRRLLEQQGLPVTGVYMPPEGAHHVAIVGIKAGISNIATQVAHLAFGCKLAPWFYHLIVVEDDVDIYNLGEVLHALGTKCHPAKGIKVYHDTVGNFATPFLSQEERDYNKGAKVLFDCTFPPEWPRHTVPQKVSFEKNYPADIKEKVLARWDSYGFS